MLDAAKTNRAVSLFRMQSSLDDLKKIARVLFSSKPDHAEIEETAMMSYQPSTKEPFAFIDRFLDIYMKRLDKEFRRFYGVRDVVHFLLYLYRKSESDNISSPRLVVEALERNFNGNESVLNALITSVLTLVSATC